MEQPGYYQGRHYTTYIIDVQALIQDGKLVAAEQLLFALLDVVESENVVYGTGVAPWYYKQLLRICRLQGNLDAEVAIIERYNLQPNAHPQAYFALRLTQVYRYATA